MKRLLLLISAFFILNNTSAQNYRLSLNDSLNGFDEASIVQYDLSHGVDSKELSLHLAVCRRNYIKEKYHLETKPVIFNYPENTSFSKTNVAACVNEDFEEGSLSSPVPGTINVTFSAAINGWNANGASNPTSGVNDNCIDAYTYTNPSAVQLLAPGPAGLTDAIIGAGYKIYSVFGSTAVAYPGAAAMDAFNHYGDWFAKINNQSPGSSVNRLTKTINVTPSNVYFNFAVIVVMEGSHGCCDGGSVSIKFKDCLGNMLATAQQYSIAASPSCATSGSLTILTSSVNPTWKYNKWANSSIDLSPWMGQCVVAEFTAYDCVYTGHAGYAYIDAQCAPVVVNGISTPSNYIYYKAYPNPSSGDFNLEISKEIRAGKIEVRNVLGQIVYIQNVIQGKNIINTEGLAKGIYNYSVYSNDNVVSVGKVVIE